MIPVCLYCDKKSELVGGDIIYPHRPDLAHKKFYFCKPCDAYVGCHGGGTKPLGRLANRELRKLKSQAHSFFDPIWKQRKMTRADAYKWLSEKLDIPIEQTHIGMFDVDLCKKTIENCKELL